MASIWTHEESRELSQNFCFLESESAANIHIKVVNIYGKGMLDVNIVTRWVSGVNDSPREKGETDLIDRPCSGRVATAVNEDKVKQAIALIKADKRITIDKTVKTAK